MWVKKSELQPGKISVMATEALKIPSELLRPRHWPTWVGVGLFWLVSKLPQPMRHRLGFVMGRLVWRFNHKRRHIIDVNLRLCFPEWTQEKRDEVNQQHFQEMGRAILDSGLIWFGSDEPLLAMTELSGWSHYQAARAEGKNIILHVAHSAALDFGAIAIGRREAGVGPYKQARNPLVDWLIARGRRRCGNVVFERSDGMMAYVRALKKGKILYTLSDEDHGPTQSVFAPFFGQPKATLPMVGRLAKVAKAAVLPVMTYYEAGSGRYHTRIGAALEHFPSNDTVKDATQLNAALEAMIRHAPEQYMWTLRLFRTQQDGKKIYHYR